ncbi:hypothetical protein M422DRAFT_258210 [Sphaerobolus stellatus SS14]|uniref:Uncharacterized protein n=1 Tax=Sphaerobolus stellatus (strain SS14) TaxID=990650 RepID=A0A0C9UW04_SPHS4|nr:hypothetical protein M422DRAFT_258210 [Sphaerobolus stellatus SS14]
MPSSKPPRFGLSREERAKRQTYQTQRNIASDEVDRDYDDTNISHLVAQPRHEFYANRELVDAMLPPERLTWKERFSREEAESRRLPMIDGAISEIREVRKDYLRSSEEAKLQGNNQTNAVRDSESPRQFANSPSPEFTQLSPRPGRVPRVIPPATNHQRSPSQMTTSTIYTEERSNSNTSTRRSYDTGRHSSNYDSEAGHSSINNPRHSVYSTVGRGITQSHTNVETRRSSGWGSTSTSQCALSEFLYGSLKEKYSSAGSGGARRSTSSSGAQSSVEKRDSGRAPQKRKDKGKGKEPESTFNITSTKRYPDDDNDRSSGSRGGGHGRTIAYNTSSQDQYRE